MSEAASKPGGKSLSTDNKTIECTTKSCEYLADDKALKKKLKKERQKDKKNLGKPKLEPEVDEKLVKTENMESATIVVVTGDDKYTNNKALKTDDDKDTNKSLKSDDDDDDDDENADINYSTMVSAFVQSIVTKNDSVKMRMKKEAAKGKDSFKEPNHKSNNTLFPDDTDGFVSVKKGGKMAPPTFRKTPEGFGIEALRVIRQGNYPLAINYLNRAIDLDPTDARHYINRSYCCLRVGNFSRALADIQYASSHFSDITEMSQAKCREGQAYCGLQNYEGAERAFSDSINLAPDNSVALREFKRMQVVQMVRMGFNERDALLALQECPSTMDAINLLAEKASSTNNWNDDSTANELDDENEIFVSDSEDDPSNERLLSRIINYDPNKPEEPMIREPPPGHNIVSQLKQTPRAPSVERTLRVIKAVPVAKCTKSNQAINDKAVWVGSLSDAISESKMQKRFSRFGKVIGVWKPLNECYAFVNFQCTSGPQKVFEEAKYNGGCIDLDGSKLIVKPATIKTSK